MNDIISILHNLVDEIKAISPQFQDLLKETNVKLEALFKLNLIEDDYARKVLPVLIASEASKKILLLLENNLLFLETVSMLALTRYMFELHVWLKSIEKERLRSIEFFLGMYEEQEKHIKNYIAKLENEANFFDALSKEDGIPKDLLLNSEELTAEFIKSGIAKNMSAVDLKARRMFSLYRRDAIINGYSFQANLIRTKAIRTAQVELGKISLEKTDFEKRVSKPLIHKETLGQKGKRKKWNCNDEAKKVNIPLSNKKLTF